MKRTRVVISGYGRMGAEIAHLLNHSKELKLVAIVGRGLKVNNILCAEKFGLLNPKDVDVVIDFSSPELFENALLWCQTHQIPVVSGTTGLSLKQKNGLTAVAKKTPVLWAPNMSMGIAFVQSLLKNYSLLQDFDFQIEETHHNKKKDKPSGTAILLQNELERAVKANLPKPISIRGGGIFGNHRVLAMGQEETIVIEHNALNRAVFARGAIRAATWIMKKKTGLYSMQSIFEKENG